MSIFAHRVEIAGRYPQCLKLFRLTVKRQHKIAGLRRVGCHVGEQFQLSRTNHVRKGETNGHAAARRELLIELAAAAFFSGSVDEVNRVHLVQPECRISVGGVRSAAGGNSSGLDCQRCACVVRQEVVALGRVGMVYTGKTCTIVIPLLQALRVEHHIVARVKHTIRAGHHKVRHLRQVVNLL